MKKNIIPGIIFCLTIPTSIYMVFFKSNNIYEKVILVTCWIILLRLFLFNKKASERRKNMYGSSNIFVALFKDEIKQEVPVIKDQNTEKPVKKKVLDKEEV